MTWATFRDRLAGLAPFLWLAYVIVPVEGWGLFHGRPLGGFDALAIAAFCWLWWMRRSVPFAVVAVAALVAKIALGATLLVPRGFDARYYANPNFAAPVERGTEPTDPTFTRIDRRLSFLGEANGDLPLYFLNDNARFNFYLPTEPARAALPVSVVWEGWLYDSTGYMKRLYVRAPGGRVVLSIGEALSATIPPSTTEWVGYFTPSVGSQRIRITLAIPQGGARSFDAGWTVDGLGQPFGSSMVFRAPVTSGRLAVDWAIRAISTVFDLVLCGGLFAGVLAAFVSAWRRVTAAPSVRDALAIAWSVVIVDALFFAWQFREQMVTLSGGDDWLTYETRARDIGLNSIWMLRGAALGEGSPFFEMPLYPYFLAATHWLCGDDLYGAHLLQRFMVGGTVIALWRMTAVLFGERVGCAGLLAAFVIVYEKVGPWSGILLTELLFVPLVCVWALQLVKLGRSSKPSAASAAAAGAVGGLATLTRSTLMMGWPLALLLTTLSLWGTRRVIRTASVLIVAMMAVISLATVRNWVVARKFVLINAYGSFNLLLANAPPASFVMPPDRKATYDRLGLDQNTQTVVEYARQSPRTFLVEFRKRAAYTLGSFDTLAPDRGRSVFYMVVSSIALVGVLLLIVPWAWLPRAGPAALIPLSIALAHGAVLVITFPTVYGDRLLLPFYALLAPYVGIAAFAGRQGLWRFPGRGTALVMCLGLAAVCAARIAGAGPELDLPIAALAVMIWGVCEFGLPRLRAADAMAYGALALGLCIWAATFKRPGIEHALRLDLLLIATAIGSSAIVAGASTLRLPDRSIVAWLGALITVVAIVTLHRSAAGAPVMIIGGLVLGAVQSLRSPRPTEAGQYPW